MFKINRKFKVVLIILTFVFVGTFIFPLIPWAVDICLYKYINNKHNDPKPLYEFLVEEYRERIFSGKAKYDSMNMCEKKIGQKFIVYYETNSSDRCFWRKIPFNDISFVTVAGCGIQEINYQHEYFDMEKIVQKKGCDDRIYYLFTPKQKGTSSINLKTLSCLSVVRVFKYHINIID